MLSNVRQYRITIKTNSCLYECGKLSFGIRGIDVTRWLGELYDEERLLSLSQCELNLGQVYNAISRLYELCERTNSPVYYLFLAETLEVQNYKEEALQITRKGLKREPTSKSFW